MIRTILATFVLLGVLLCGVIGCDSSNSSTSKPEQRDKGSRMDQHMRNFGMYD